MFRVYEPYVTWADWREKQAEKYNTEPRPRSENAYKGGMGFQMVGDGEGGRYALRYLMTQRTWPELDGLQKLVDEIPAHRAAHDANMTALRKARRKLLGLDS